MTAQNNGLTDKNILKQKKTQHVLIFNHFDGSKKWSQYLVDGIIQMLLYVIFMSGPNGFYPWNHHHAFKCWSWRRQSLDVGFFTFFLLFSASKSDPQSVYERNSFTSYYCQFLSVNSLSVKTEITMTVIGQKQKFVNVQISVIETVIGGFCSRNLTEKDWRILWVSVNNSNFCSKQ